LKTITGRKGEFPLSAMNPNPFGRWLQAILRNMLFDIPGGDQSHHVLFSSCLRHKAQDLRYPKTIKSDIAIYCFQRANLYLYQPTGWLLYSASVPSVALFWNKAKPPERMQGRLGFFGGDPPVRWEWKRHKKAEEMVNRNFPGCKANKLYNWLTISSRLRTPIYKSRKISTFFKKNNFPTWQIPSDALFVISYWIMALETNWC